MSWDVFYRSVIDLSNEDSSIIYDKSYIYCRSFKKLSRSVLFKRNTGFYWFAMTPGYGSDDTYGPIVTTWKLTRPLQLLNISTMRYRERLIKQYNIPDSILDPDEQYSGGKGNIVAHRALEPILNSNGLDGTYISESEADEDCQGASEIVLTRKALKYIQKM